MKDSWLEILEWIQLIVSLLFLLFTAGVLLLVIKHYKLEFNRLYKTRAFLTMTAFMWGIGLLLGRHQLWSPKHGSLPLSNNGFESICRAHVFLTFGMWQPLFFLIILMTLKSKEKSKLQLYADDPNKFILYRALLWCIPVFVVHIIILALSPVHEGTPVVWRTHTLQHQHCVVPVLSTGATAIFYSFFVVLYVLSSSKLFTRLINRNLRYRIRWTQLFFIFIFPLEIILRFISIFISEYEDAYEAVYHSYYFLELIVCTVAIIELVLRPVMDAASFPMLVGVTENACQEYIKSEEEKKQRRYTKSHNALQRVKSEDEFESGQTNNNNNNNRRHVEMETLPLKSNEQNNTSPSSSSSLSPTLPPTQSIIPPSSVSVSLSPSTPVVTPTPTPAVLSHETSPTMNMNITLTAAKNDYPVDLDDIFADMDDVNNEAEDSSLKLKVDGVFLDDL